MSVAIDENSAPATSAPQGRKTKSRTSAPSGRWPYALACLTLVGAIVGSTIMSDDAPQPAQRTLAATSVIAVGAGQVQRLEAALRQNPEDLRALQQVAVAYTAEAAVGNPANYGLAREALARAEGLAPGDNTTAIARAWLSMSLHRFAEAEETAARVHRKNPNLNDATIVLIDASIELGKYPAAEALAEQLIQRKPNLSSYSRISYLRELHGDLEGAAVAMQQASGAGTAGSPEVASTTTLLGDIEYAQGKYSAAIEAYREALRAIPSLPTAQLGLARSLAATGLTSDALTLLRTLTERFPLPSAVALLGDLESRAGNSKAALDANALYNVLTTTQRQAGQVVDLEAAQYALDHDDVVHGVQFAELAFRARPDNVFTLDVRAWAQFRSGAFQDANESMQRALRLGAIEPQMLWHQAAIAASLGDRVGAKAALARLGARVPSQAPKVLEQLRRLRAQLA